MTKTWRADVGIIGAGPAGLATAIHLKQLGVGRVVVVDREDFPRHKTCGSAISPKGIEVLAKLGVAEAVSAEAYWIRGMRLVTPRGHDLRMVGHTDAALICNRSVFDHLLLKRALALGVEFIPDFQVQYLLHRGDRIVGFRDMDGHEVFADCSVVADGAHSRFAVERGPRRMIQAIMGWWDNVAYEPNQIEMIFDKLVDPYYGWLFPEGPGRVNIGICYDDPVMSKNARALFKEFLEKYYGAIIAHGTQIGGLKGHPILFSNRIDRLSSPGRLVVGEAARLTNSATGEGIYQGMASGLAAADALHAMIVGGQPEKLTSASYEARCKRAFATSFKTAIAWRKLVRSGGLDLIAKTATISAVQGFLARSMAHM